MSKRCPGNVISGSNSSQVFVTGLFCLLGGVTGKGGTVVKTYCITGEDSASAKIEEWLHLLGELFVRLEYVPTDVSADKELAAQIESRTFSDLYLHQVASTRQSLMRTPQRAKDSEGEFFLVAMQVSGVGEVKQDGRRAALAPGDFVIYDTTRAYNLDFSAKFQQLVVSVPREHLKTHVPGAENLTACKISGQRPVARLLSTMVSGLPLAIDDSLPDTHTLVSKAVLDLIVANLRSLPEFSEPSSTKLKRYNEKRIKSYVRENLADSGLTVAKIAEALDMSVSSLYRAFEGQAASVAEMIWQERLTAARTALQDRSCAGKSIKEIAFDWGFSDPAHFSRAFRQHFGTTPREFRTAALLG
ncbi:helix-turn-helix domain-containing protein [Paraburkholderia lacunae]|uniref:DNA-binding protein n=1 Tax=Paraburkholderia lacunae TaxID=2211104 RepID=A0A370N3A8_9BURK|nr:helix-turn-helix domain-containing protein [Paraburkholderia lacunae]RDK00120.1 DNA-binding protein [Paraburkholderia lacunae]